MKAFVMVAHAADTSYLLTVYPTASEAWVRRSVMPWSRLQDARKPAPPVLDIRTQLDDEYERDSRSIRRSRGRVRRYAVANGSNVLTTLTYADEHLDRAQDRSLVELDTRNAVRRMRWAWGESKPYVSMPELQPERSEREGVPIYNGMVLTSRMPRAVFDKVKEGWGYGDGDGYNGVDITRWRNKRGGASYASKALSTYAGKDLGAAAPGGQSYRVGQGFQPVPELLEVEGGDSALGVLSEYLEGLGAKGRVLGVRDAEGFAVDASWAVW